MLNDKNNPTLIIIIPCYNEEEALPECAEKLSQKISQLVSGGLVSEKSALLFVDDGSTDSTWALIEKYQGENPQMFKGIKLSENYGHQKALFCGLLAARDCADVTITIDADLQDDIDAIDRMLESYLAGAELVYGVRSNRQSDTFFKRVSAGLFYRVMRFLGADIIHNHADFRLMGRQALAALADAAALAEYNQANVFLRGIVTRLGFKSAIVYYDRKKRSLGKSKYSLRKMLKLALDAIVSLSFARKNKMPSERSPEQRLSDILSSEKTKKAAAIVVLALMLLCILPLLMPVQRLIFSSVDARASALLSLFFAAFVVLVFAFCCLHAKSIAAFVENAANTRLICGLAAGVLLLALVSIGLFSYLYGWQWLDSDHSSEMVLGKLLAEENALVSVNWFYSTEIRLVYQTIFTMPLFKLLEQHENWALIRALNIILNCLVLILSYVFMMRQIKLQPKWILISALFLIMPVSYDYWNFVLFGGYYIFFVAQLFCCLGLYIRICNRAGAAKTIWLNLILFTILSFVLGVQGIRALLAVHIPLLVACVFIWARAGQKRYFPLLLGCFGFLVCCAGYATNWLLQNWYSFQSFENMRIEHLSNFLQKLGQSLANMAGFLGLSSGSPLLSAQGFFGMAAIFATILLLRAVYKACRHDQLQDESQFIPVFFASSVFFNIFILVIVSQSVISRYFIPFMVLYIPLTAILFEHAEKTYGHLKRTAIVFGITLFIIGQSYTNVQSLVTRDINTVRKGYIQYLLDNELDFGFATFWNANVSTELSNGRIEMASLIPARGASQHNLFFINQLLKPKKYLDPLYHTGESFLLLTRSEWEQTRIRPFFTGTTPDYQDSSFVVIRFPSAELVYRELLGEL
ncbi:MAG: glycosyltransferase family 2 protein [Treponema sp.]|nr:glycosyltransferase family 2 protein [Treponema sp.]